MKKRRQSRPSDDFIAPARRALRRAARKARQENHKLGLPLITFKNGKAAGARKRSKR